MTTIEQWEKKIYRAHVSHIIPMNFHSINIMQTAVPPTAPRNVEIIEVTSTSVSLRWNPPAELGGRDDFFYSLTVIEGNKTRSTVVAGNVTTETINSTLN